MKKKIKDLIKRKEELLQTVNTLRESEHRSTTLADLDKNAIEISAQLKVLNHLLYN